MKETAVGALKKKLARFCAWRERCTAEAEEKLISLGAGKKEITQVIKWLREEKYLNDERFATAFASGKFSYNQWGKVRIAAELGKRGIEKDLIEQALAEIDQEAYQKTARVLAQKKFDEVKADSFNTRKQKTAAYLLSKGFGNETVWSVINTLAPKEDETEE